MKHTRKRLAKQAKEWERIYLIPDTTGDSKRIEKKRGTTGFPFHVVLAEGEGFKPPIPEKGIPDFESSAIDHSANLPIKREQKRACSHFVEREEGQLKTEPSEYK